MIILYNFFIIIHQQEIVKLYLPKIINCLYEAIITVLIESINTSETVNVLQLPYTNAR